MGYLITLAAASLIGMSGILASTIGISRNIETVVQNNSIINELITILQKTQLRPFFRPTDKKVRQTMKTFNQTGCSLFNRYVRPDRRCNQYRPQYG